MTMIAGTTLGPYEIVALLGAGGMARSTKPRHRLDRIVAIKILPAHVATDATRRERFEREAGVISQLNHPHICTTYAPRLNQRHVENPTIVQPAGRCNF